MAAAASRAASAPTDTRPDPCAPPFGLSFSLAGCTRFGFFVLSQFPPNSRGFLFLALEGAARCGTRKSIPSAPWSLRLMRMTQAHLCQITAPRCTF